MIPTDTLTIVLIITFAILAAMLAISPKTWERWAERRGLKDAQSTGQQGRNIPGQEGGTTPPKDTRNF